MTRIQTIILGAIILLPTVTSSQSLYSTVGAGEHSVGFRIERTYDAGRTYLQGGQYVPRPLQVAVWYPGTTL